mgnify:FL=1
MHVAKQYPPPLGYQGVKLKIKEQFFTRRHIEEGSREWKLSLAWGRYELKQMTDFLDFHRFRRLRHYDWTQESNRPPQPPSIP